MSQPILDEQHETIVKVQFRNPLSKSKAGIAILVQIYPTGPQMGVRHTLGPKPLLIGRDDACDIIIRDNSTSRRHACIELEGSTFCVHDLHSTNGTLLNEIRVEQAELKDGDYLHVGNSIFRFLMGHNVEALYHEEIYRLTIIDALTEIHNKRYLLEYLDREIARAVRYGRPLSLVMFDIDRFKRINDEQGHLAGDFILRELSITLKEVVRRDELLARYGGEEFTMVLPECPLEGALDCAERLRIMVQDHSFEFEEKNVPVTMSLGVATFSGGQTISVSDLIRNADEALYRAKELGRNRVCSKVVES